MLRLGWSVLLLLLLLPTAAFASSDPRVLAARVWGLIKYHHPDVVACQVDWDGVLLSQWPAIEASGDDPEPALAALVAAAGSVQTHDPADPDVPGWIRESDLSAALQQQLAWIATQRPETQCYVQRSPIEHADFLIDDDHLDGEPDRATRALSALRFWNAIEWFFPYKAEIGREWIEVLAERLPDVLDAPTSADYARAMLRLVIAIEDSHGTLIHPSAGDFIGAGSPPFRLRLVEGRPVVAMVQPDHEPVAPGDEVLAVDGQPIGERIAAHREQVAASNPVYRDFHAMVRALTGAPNPGLFRLRRPDGSEYEVELQRRSGNLYDSAMPDAPLWSVHELDGCRMGVIDMGRIEADQVDVALADLATTDALVFDVRNYPKGTVGRFASRLFDAPHVMARFTIPDQSRPGTFFERSTTFSPSAPIGYAGPRLVLFDERSISHAEYSVMGLEADGRAITFGSQTAAADGNITRLPLPGDMTSVFTGLGVYYPDGRSTQRIGIVPDVHVTPTIAGLAAGRDEVLEAALDCRWLDQRPARRTPRQGLYYAAARDGEGIDVHHDASGNLAVFSYGYDDDGEPEWLLAAGDSQGDAWSQAFQRRFADGTLQAVDDFSLDAHRGPYEVACAIADQSALHPRALWRWPGDGGEADICVTPLLLSAPGSASGTWAGPPEESGWGLSMHHADGNLAVVFYAYDGSGHPRWMIANAPWNGSDVIELDLRRTRGFCRSCAPAPPAYEDAGTLRLDLGGLQSGQGSDNRLDIDAEFADGSRWVRVDMPLFQITGADPAGSR